MHEMRIKLHCADEVDFLFDRWPLGRGLTNRVKTHYSVPLHGIL